MRLIGHGIDIVEVDRVGAMLAEHGQRMLERLFTPTEQQDAMGEGGADVRQAQRLAARFAAKEAAMKALGTGLADGVHWTDVGVELLGSGAPVLRVTGRAAEIAAERGITQWRVSLTHTRTYAAASVLALSEE